MTSRNNTSRHRTKRYAETGSPWCAPSRLKYDVVIPALIMQDSWLLSRILTHLIKLWPDTDFLRQASKNEFFKESNAFSMSTVTIYHLKLKMLLISDISVISLPLSPINLFLIHKICWYNTKSVTVSFDLVIELLTWFCSPR